MKKVNYGIYLGVTSSSIAKMEEGIPVILKSNSLKDTMPVCIYFNKKGSIQVGDAANNANKREIIKNQKGWNSSSNNAFVEFTRTLGTDKNYYSINANRSFTSTELIAEIIKTLISFEKGKDVNAAVITVPAAFNKNQKEAVREAGKLAGLQQVEILCESVASSLAYGLDSIKFQGYSLVFSFDDVFNVSLMKNNSVVDTESDNYLGSKNLDFAIIDEIILPYIQENFVIDSILADDIKKQILRNALRFYAEEAKKKLSSDNQHNILSYLGDIPGEDDEGEEFELDIAITQTDITKVLSPVFQKAIDISKSLLKRNNLEDSALDSLILVGGPTFSPVLRKMLEDQICKPDTSIDPKTVIVKGVALYASTIDVSEEAQEQKRDKNKIQLEIANESSTVETEEFVPIKILEDKTEGEIPEKVFAEFTRGDKAWSSGKIEINTIGEVVEIQLNKGETNIFEVVLFDHKGNVLESEPSTFSVIQGSKIGSATLAYNIGIEIKDKTKGKIIFRTIKGLEKNQSIPAVGTYNGIKTELPIRPGVESDFIKIPIYEGEHGADGTRAIYNEHVLDVIISGTNLPTLLPENSDFDLMINVDRSEKITVTAYFPSIDFSIEVNTQINYNSISLEKVEDLLFELTENEILTSSEFQNYFEQLSKLKKNLDIDTLQEIFTQLKAYGRKT
jgi:molecular chaperone DnaK